MRKMFAWVFISALFTACDDVAGPGQEAEFQAVRNGQDQIVVMTRNLFVGAAVEDVFDVASPEEIPLKVAEMWAAVQATDFEARAAAFADEVSRFQPHLIGLQEVTTFYKQTPSDFDPAAFNPGVLASDVELDFLQVYRDALAAAGLQYEVVAVAPHFTAEVPMLDIPDACGSHVYCLSDMRLQDFDVILARADVDYDPSSVVESNFPDYLTLVMPDVGLPLPRGWASVDANVAGIDFRFAVTHLEPPDQDGVVVDGLEELQRGQAVYLQEQLLTGLPVILVGDLNTDAYGQSTDTYGDFMATGWVDAWGNRHGGFTCCQTEDLLTWPSILDRRVDLILMNGDFGLGPLGFEGGVHAWIVGNRNSDRTDDGLWPSDHAGVVAALRPHRHR